MSENEDNSKDSAAIRAVERRLNKQEALAEASKEMVSKLAKEIFRDKKTRNAIARDCIDGIQGKNVNPNDPKKLAGRDGGRIPASLINEDLPTGFDKFPWQEDEE